MSKSLALITIILYTFFAFFQWSFNPEEWSATSRAFFGVFWIFSVFIGYEYHSSENKNPYSKR